MSTTPTFGGRRLRAVLAAGILAALAVAGSPPADAGSPLSQGAALFVGASRDATHVYFFSVDRLDRSDRDSTKDLYEAAGGRQTLVAASAAQPSGATDASLRAVSANGSHVYFQTKEGLVAEDTDSAVDAYDRSGGAVSLISTGPQNANGPGAGRYQAASADGTRVVFSSPDALVPEDTDSVIDLYLRDGGTTTLLTPGTAQAPVALSRSDRGIFGIPRTRAAVDREAERVLFATAESLLPADLDDQIDLYARSGGATEFVSTGPTDDGTCPAVDCDAELEALSTDGSRVVFDTRSALIANDGDGANDLYARDGGTIELLSLREGGPNVTFPQFHAASIDASRVVFGASERLTSDDRDPYFDLFERVGGETTLVSGGLFDRTFPGAGRPGVEFLGASADLSRILFLTEEGLLRRDRFDDDDIYSRAGGRTTIVSGSRLDQDDENSTVSFGGVSADGSTVYFTIQDRLVGADRGYNRDLYGRRGKRLFLVSRGPQGRRGATLVLAISPDGRRVVFTSARPLLRSDRDDDRDLYERRGRRLTLLTD
jgi:hypothetical protein